MHAILHIVFSAFAGLSDFASVLARLVSPSGQASQSDIVPAAIVVSSLVIAAASTALALVFRVRLIANRQSTRARLNRSEAALLLRDAVISAGREAVVVLHPGASAPLSFAGGQARLDACLRGADGTVLSSQMERLLQEGIPFSLSAAAPDGRRYMVRGCPIGGHAAIFLREEALASVQTPRSETILDALPFPVWVRDKNLDLRWANHAFLAVTDCPNVDRAVAWNVVLGEFDGVLAKAALGGSEIIDARHYTTIAGQRRALAFSMRPLANGEMAGVAVDVTDLNPTDTELQERAKLEIASMDLLSAGIAIFGRDRNLVHYNRPYALQWELSELWLDTHPSLDEILERLREARRLPERRDYSSWKREHLNLFDMKQTCASEIWHLASGRSVRVEARRHDLGGLVFIYDDITERLRLESAFNTVVMVQKAMLDQLKEAVAVFGPDGRLKQHNAAFSQLWRFADGETSGEPHLNRLADISAMRIGRDEFWEIVRSGVASSEPDRGNEWGLITRADGKPLLLSMSRLPDGSTLVTVREAPDGGDAASQSLHVAA